MLRKTVLALVVVSCVANVVLAQPKLRTRFGSGESMPEDQPKVLLWPEGAPDAKGSEEVDQTWVWLYPAPADKANGTAVVVCPGGGYRGLAIHHEGHDVARWLNERGISAFVLKYRLSPNYQHPIPLGDAQRAVRLVRARAKEWNVDPNRVGIWGFSAGGHLASTVATHFDQGRSDASDPIDRQSCRPDFAVLCYPVITMTEPYMHAGSRRNLLGENPDTKLALELSTERQITAETPPTFIFHTAEDAGVPVENAIAFFQGLRAAKVPAEMHIYEKGPHGVGLGHHDPTLATWPERLHDWLRGRGLLD